jgi:RHS repeat-associated protein
MKAQANAPVLKRFQAIGAGRQCWPLQIAFLVLVIAFSAATANSVTAAPGSGYGPGSGLPGSGSGNSYDSIEMCPASAPPSTSAQSSGCCGTGQSLSGHGMPVWRVSDNVLDLMLYDRPLWYQPSRGNTVAFDLFFKNLLGTNGAAENGNPKFFSVGTNWHTPWRAYVLPDASVATNAVVFRGDGTARIYSLDVVDYNTSMKLEWASPGYTLTAASGERWSFTSAIITGTVTNWFLNQHSDPHGHALQFSYDHDVPLTFLQLVSVTDADGASTSFEYTNSGPYPNLISSVTAPDGRVTRMTYNGLGQLTNIVDMGNLASGFSYDSTNNLRDLITPYGTTTFSLWAAETNWSAIRIAELGFRTNFWLYLNKDDSSRMSTNSIDRLPIIASQLPSSWDTNESHLRNTFFWNQRRVEKLSANFRTNLLNESFDPANVTSNDFKIARQQHWLRNISTPVPGRALSFEREPSPDGVVEGQITWYDYEGKPSGTNWMEGSQYGPRCIAWKLPDASARYTYYNRNALGYPTNEFETFDVGGMLRSNRFEYAANGVDLSRHIRYVGATEKAVSSNVFNSAHLVRSNWNALNELTVFTYEGSNRLTSITHPSGLFTTNFYGSNGRLASTVDKDDAGGTALRTNAYTWTNGLVLTHTDPRGTITTNTYDVFGRLVQVNDGLGVATFAYNKLDLIKTVDRMGFTRSNLYNSFREVLRSVDARGFTNSYDYCNCGSLDSSTDRSGNTTTFNYDYAGRLLKTTRPGGSWVSNFWNSMGELSYTVDNAGVALTNVYNQQGLLIRVNGHGGQVTEHLFDIEDQIYKSTDANGVTVTNLFDALGRVFVRGLDATNSTEGFAWSARGLVRYTNQLGHVTTNGYDVLGRKVGETNSNGEKVRFSYAPGGELLTLTDGKDQVTTWSYDSFGRNTNKADNLGTNVFVYRYDLNSRLTYRWTPAKGDTGYTNDANDNVTFINYSNSPDITLSYDASDRLTNMVDAVGTNRFTYTSFGALLSEDGPWDSDTVTYAYTTNRLRKSLTLAEFNAGDWVQTYAYDLANRLTNTTSPAGAFAYAYKGVGAAASPAHLINKLTLPSGAYITNAYDPVARLVSTTLKNSSHSALNAHAYELNAAHQRIKQTRYDNSFADYTYDPIGQLSTALGKENGGTTNRSYEQFRYTYDAAGNVSNRVANVLTNTFNVNSLNELTTVTRTTNFTLAGFTTIAASSVTVNGSSASRYADNTFGKDNLALVDGNNTFTAIATDTDGRGDTNAVTLSLPATVTFASDLNGNMTTNGSRLLEYDDENQLTRITEPSSWRSEFVYDGKLRRRVRKEYEWRNGNWVKTNEVHYIYDGNLVVQERNEFNVALKSFTRGSDLSGTRQRAGGIGGLLAFSDHAAASAYHIDFQADGNGNITALLDRNQQVVGRYLYDPFGYALAVCGPLAGVNAYRFSSKELHSQSECVYYLYRYYSPHLTRWLNRDPIQERGGLNLYQALVNAPVDLTDSYGLREPQVRLPNVKPKGGIRLTPNGKIPIIIGPVAGPIGVAIVGGVVGAELIEVIGEHMFPDPGPEPLPRPRPPKVKDPNKPDRDRCLDVCDAKDWDGANKCALEPDPGERALCYEKLSKDLAKCIADCEADWPRPGKPCPPFVPPRHPNWPGTPQ